MSLLSYLNDALDEIGMADLADPTVVECNHDNVTIEDYSYTHAYGTTTNVRAYCDDCSEEVDLTTREFACRLEVE